MCAVTERVDSVIARVAAELDLELVGMFGDGEFGAALVRDGSGRERVLKALPGPEWAPRFARGAQLSALVRAPSYPVPLYYGTGVAVGATWSLQERLPGNVPDVMSGSHARQLLELLSHHVDAGDRDGDVARRFEQQLGDGLERIASHAETAALAIELSAALALLADLPVRKRDVVHGDFHHRNFLAVGDEVTGVFDWELSWVGDWRVDLVNIACWGSWVPWQIPAQALHPIVEAARSACEPRVLAVFAAFHTARAVEFNLRVHPDRLPWLLETIDSTTREWLHPG